MKSRVLGWALAIAIVFAAASLVAHYFSTRVTPTIAAHPRYDQAAALGLPIPVINFGVGAWPFLLTIWVMLTAAALLGWGLARAAAAARNFELALAFALVALAAAFFPAMVSSDPYAYVIWGRFYGVYHHNPYLATVDIHAVGDRALETALRYFRFRPPPDDYGPLWTALAGTIARIESSASLWLWVWTHRLVALVSAGAAALGIWRALRSVGQAERRLRVARFLFHPLVLFECCIGGHNDMVMVAFAVWAFAVVADYPIVAGILLGASMATKFVSVIALPFLAIVAARSRASPSLGLLAAAGATAAAVAVTAAAFLPLWIGPATIGNVLERAGIVGMSPAWLLGLPFLASGNLAAAGWIVRAFELLFFAVAVYSVWRFLKDGRFAHLWRSITALLWSLPLINPWYAQWLSPALAARGPWMTFAWWFGALIVLRYGLDVLEPSSFPGWAQVALTIAILGIPVAAALRARRYEARPA